MDISMSSSLLVILHLFYMLDAKALQTYEDNGVNYNYIYGNYLKESPGILDMHRPYTDSHIFENRYVPLIDGHPIFIPPLSSNQYETAATGYYSKKLPVSNVGVGKKYFAQKYSYGKDVKDAASKSSETILDQMPESPPLKINGLIDKSTKLQSQAGNNWKYKTPINSDKLVNHIDNSYDDPTVIESKYAEHFDKNYDYPKVTKDWRETSHMENYYSPVVVEKLIKENPIEDIYVPVQKQDLIIKKPNLGIKGNEAVIKKQIVNANLLKETPDLSEFTNKKSHLNSNKNKDTEKSTVKDYYDEPHVIKVSQHQNPIEINKVPTETKFIKTKPNYGEILRQADYPVDALSNEKSKIAVKHKPVKVSSEDKYPKYVFEGKPAKHLVDKHHNPSKIKHFENNQIRELEALSKKPFVEKNHQIEAKEEHSEYSNLDTIAEKKQYEESDNLIIEHPIPHAPVTKKKGETYVEYPVTVVSNKNLSNPKKKTSNKNKGDSTHKIKVKGHATHKVKGHATHKVKGDETHKIKAVHKKPINNSPHISVPSKAYNQGYEMLDQTDTFISPNIPQIDLDEVEFENDDNVPFEVGSGIIQERDMGQDSRNLFSESGIWSQMVNFHSQERSKFKKCITPKNETGNCMPIQLCPDPNLALNLDDLVKKVCSIDEVFVGICCPEFSAETLKVDWEDFNTNDSEQENVEEIQSTVACGQIVNSGEDVLSWPWMAPLISASTRRIFCGGVLINEQYVLTAAHCTRRVPRNQILVILGPITATQEPANQEFTVGEIKRHARYNPRTMQNDIALLKLSKPVPMGEFRRFVCLPTEMEVFVGEPAVMLGWQGSFAMTKNVEHLRVLPNEECKNQVKDTLCSEPRTEDSMCNLDSGAPLIIQKDGSYKVIGILTWDRNDCDSRFPAIYTNVSSFLKWIEVHSSS